MHKDITMCNKTQSKWCINKHGASKIIDTFETYHPPLWWRKCPKTPPIPARPTMPPISSTESPSLPPKTNICCRSVAPGCSGPLAHLPKLGAYMWSTLKDNLSTRASPSSSSWLPLFWRRYQWWSWCYRASQQPLTTWACGEPAHHCML
jgi:hypothetical protein